MPHAVTGVRTADHTAMFALHFVVCVARTLLRGRGGGGGGGGGGGAAGGGGGGGCGVLAPCCPPPPPARARLQRFGAPSVYGTGTAQTTYYLLGEKTNYLTD
jgi:hypothetical protein